ncbi:hypothetical protein Tco_0752701 [Tanacetum coccineum]|uniref:Uncharacterized protein n=1 Tax=Tanacetum coccineum TaxID=301880 RepID=A0ABQ4Z7R0_9ASTR
MDWSPQCNDFLVRVSCDDDVEDVNIVEPMLVMVIFKEITESVIKKEDMAKRKMMNSCRVLLAWLSDVGPLEDA